jgi:hypothetical protein
MVAEPLDYALPAPGRPPARASYSFAAIAFALLASPAVLFWFHLGLYLSLVLPVVAVGVPLVALIGFVIGVRGWRAGRKGSRGRIIGALIANGVLLALVAWVGVGYWYSHFIAPPRQLYHGGP